jgi:transcriptional regulator with XRE-family HTH domain
VRDFSSGERRTEGNPVLSIDERKLVEFGHRVRERRLALRLSVRALADLAGVSASYISAIETARNSTTGRAPEPSIGVAERLLKALDLPSTHLARLCEHDEERQVDGCNHLLLYRLGVGHGRLKPILDQLFDDSVDQWFCIADPRGTLEEAADLISLHWPFGANPYPNDYLEPGRILKALELELRKHIRRVKPRRPGLVIADCSTVMRWVVNPECEVDFETGWAELSGNVLKRVYGQAPIANVCVYDHSDIESLSARIDLLDTLLRLFSSHTNVVAIDSENRIQKGPAAVATILLECKPGGVSSAAWRSLTSAAAATLAYDRSIEGQRPRLG